MTDNIAPKDEPVATTEHTVSTANQTASRAPRTGKTVSFTVPTIPRPRISFKNLRARTKITAVLAILLLGGAGGYLGATIQEKTGDVVLSGSVSNEKRLSPAKVSW